MKLEKWRVKSSTLSRIPVALTKNPHVALSEFNRVATNPIVHPGAQTQALIEYKANVNVVDDMQETPLHKACVKSGDYEIVTRSLSDFLIGFVQNIMVYHGLSSFSQCFDGHQWGYLGT